MGLHVLMSSRTTCRMALVLSTSFAIKASTRVLKSIRASAIAAFRAIMAAAQLACEPMARNSNRLPVKAKGDVRLRSVLSNSSSGICGMSSFMPCLLATSISSSSVECSKCSSMSLSCWPRKEEMMVGGASCPPRRWAVSVASDQLLCLPDPLIPANGFSCSKQRNPCLRAIFFISDMSSMLWSTARLVSS